MFRRYIRIVVAVVFILVFVSMLRLPLRISDDVHEAAYMYTEHTYPAGHQPLSKRPPFLNQVTAKRNSAPADDESYHNHQLLEGGIQAAKPLTQSLPFVHGNPRNEPEPSHYSSDSHEHEGKNDLDQATNLLHERQLHVSEKQQDVYKPQAGLTADTLRSDDKIAENYVADTGQMTAPDAHYVRIQNGSIPMAPANLGKQTEREEIQRQRSVNRARQRSVHVESLDALKRQHTHKSVWDDSNASDLGFWDVLNRSYVDQHVPRPWIGSYQCKDVICSEFLFKRDWDRVGKCVKKLSKKHIKLINKARPTLRPACHFMNGTSRRGVALLSFPGSGNTWLRGLLERATGICTGEVHSHSATIHGPEYIVNVKLHTCACMYMYTDIRS